MTRKTTILVTGAAGFIGARVTAALAAHSEHRVVAVDVARAPGVLPANVHSEVMDIRDPGLGALLRDHTVRRVVHLASVVTPPPGMTRAEQEDIDIGGTRNLLSACVGAGVDHITVTSSGAAYGYHADNPVPLQEHHPLRGNAAFAYADHKRRIEVMLADYRARHPELRQLVLRPGTVLGPTVNNQITAMFERPFLLAIAGHDSPFVFIHDQDVVNIIALGVLEARSGIFNLAGDGAPGMRELARLLGRPRLPVPAVLVRGAIRLLGLLGRTALEPAQVDFLRYRPVLDNTALKRDFGYVPAMSSREVFLDWARQRGLLTGGDKAHG